MGACGGGGGDGQALQGIWAEVLSLRVCEVASNVPFSEYGGDSLLGIEVLSLAARRHVPLGDAGALTAVTCVCVLSVRPCVPVR